MLLRIRQVMTYYTISHFKKEPPSTDNDEKQYDMTRTV